MSFALVLDIAVAVLLAVTIGSSFVLYRRLSRLRQAQSEMSGVVDGFGAATERAQAGLLSLKAAGTDLAHALQDRIDEARTVSDDLSVLTESGNRLADRLDALLGEGRSQVDVRTAGLGGSSAAAAPALDSEAERELVEALRQAR